jgi:hypothetical protein
MLQLERIMFKYFVIRDAFFYKDAVRGVLELACRDVVMACGSEKIVKPRA